MYAIIKTGGKQYKVKEGQMIKVEKLDAEKGDQIIFDIVLQYSGEEGYKFGKPYLEDAERIFNQHLTNNTNTSPGASLRRPLVPFANRGDLR